MKRFVLGIFLLICFVNISCKKPLAFEYRDIRDFKVSNFSSEKAQVGLNLVYFNPNKFGVNLKKVNCDLFIDSMYIGKFQLDTFMRINPVSEFSIPARLEVNLNNILKNSVNLLFNEVTITAKGTSRVGRGGFYINVPVDYSGKHKLNLF